jgi:hypothetical protein
VRESLHPISRQNKAERIASESTHRHDPAFRCLPSYRRASTPSSTPMCKPTNTPMRSRSGKRLILGHQLSPAAVSRSRQPHYGRADGARTGQAVIAQPMNGGTNALRLKTVLFRVQPSMPTLTKTTVGHPPLAAVLLGSQTCDEPRRLACHRAIAPVANGTADGVSSSMVLPDTTCRSASPVGLEVSARALAAKPNWITSTRSNCRNIENATI